MLYINVRDIREYDYSIQYSSSRFVLWSGFVTFSQQMVKNNIFSPRKRPFHSTWSKGQNRAFSNFSWNTFSLKIKEQIEKFRVPKSAPEVLWSKNVTFSWHASKMGRGGAPHR